MTACKATPPLRTWPVPGPEEPRRAGRRPGSGTSGPTRWGQPQTGSAAPGRELLSSNWVEWSERPDPLVMPRPPATGVVPPTGLGLASGARLLSACLQTPPSSAFPLGLGASWGVRELWVLWQHATHRPGRAAGGEDPGSPGRRTLCPCHPQRVPGGGGPRSRLGRAQGKLLPRRPRAAAKGPGEGPPRRPRAAAPRPL